MQMPHIWESWHVENVIPRNKISITSEYDSHQDGRNEYVLHGHSSTTLFELFPVHKSQLVHHEPKPHLNIHAAI